MSVKATSEMRITHRVRRNKVTRVYMAVTDYEPDEGILKVSGPHNIQLPLVALDERSLPALERYAQNVANELGRKVTIICFTNRRVCESFSPVSTGG